MITFYTTYLISCLIAFFMGVIEGVMFCGSVKKEHISEFWKRKTKSDIHILLTIFRGLVYGLLAFLTYKIFGIFDSAIYLLSVALSFSFFHNSGYYYTRSKLDGAYTGIFDSSINTTAKFSFDFNSRLVLFLISLVIILIYMFLK
jgi:hypothetical protein